jgi:farnesyl diphosphate synthase
MNKSLLLELSQTWDEVMDVLNAYVRKVNEEVAPDWYKKCLSYNVPHGKRFRAITVVGTCEILSGNKNRNDYNTKLSCIMGWCVELLQAMALVNDDMMDNSETRRGKKCWYKIDNVGYSAIIDALMLYEGIFILLKEYFSGKTYFVEVVALFHKITMITVLTRT